MIADRSVAFLSELDLAAGNAGDFEEVIDQSHQVVDLSLHDSVEIRGGLRRTGEAQDVQGVANRREGIAQLVGERGKELVLSPVRLFERTCRSVALDEMSPRPVLPVSGAQRAADRARQSRYADGALEQRDIAEGVYRFRDARGIGSAAARAPGLEGQPMAAAAR